MKSYIKKKLILITHSKLILLEMPFLRGIETDDISGSWQHTTNYCISKSISRKRQIIGNRKALFHRKVSSSFLLILTQI